MRHLAAVLENCERCGVYLAVRAGNGLEVRGELTAELREDLRRHKPNILHYLRTDRCHHNLEPDVCKLCNGYVRRLIEGEAS